MIANGIVSLPFIDNLYKMHQASAWIFTISSLTFFISSRVYHNSYSDYQQKRVLTKAFHSANHRYRNLIDEIINYKKDNTIYNLPVKGEHTKILDGKYYALLSKVCNQAATDLNQLVHDDKGYISLKLLKFDSETKKIKLVHQDAFPDRYPGEYLDNIEIIRSSSRKPANLFEEIINDYLNKKEKRRTESWKLGRIYNDLFREENFKKDLLEGNNIRYKSTIIISLTINNEIVGFMCYNCNRVGHLRRDHLHFLAGHCDLTACILRNILL